MFCFPVNLVEPFPDTSVGGGGGGKGGCLLSL